MTPSPNKSTQRSQFEEVCKILDDHHRDPRRLIPILQQAQKTYRYLPKEVITFIATSLDLSPAKVYGVATFYAHFALEPKGKHIIRVCNGTACHVKGADLILEDTSKRLKLSGKKNTTEDMLYTLESVSCLGACGLAPVVVIDDEVLGQQNAASVNKALDALSEGGQG